MSTANSSSVAVCSCRSPRHRASCRRPGAPPTAQLHDLVWHVAPTNKYEYDVPDEDVRLCGAGWHALRGCCKISRALHAPVRPVRPCSYRHRQDTANVSLDGSTTGHRSRKSGSGRETRRTAKARAEAQDAVSRRTDDRTHMTSWFGSERSAPRRVAAASSM